MACCRHPAANATFRPRILGSLERGCFCRRDAHSTLTAACCRHLAGKGPLQTENIRIAGERRFCRRDAGCTLAALPKNQQLSGRRRHIVSFCAAQQLSFNRNIVRTLKAGIPGAVLASLAGLILLIFPFGDELKRWSFDLLAALKPMQATEEVVLIYIDDISHTKLDQPYDAPWDRLLDEKLVERLRGFGARTIGFDVLFDQPATNAASDATFAEAIRKHGKVVLGATISRGDYFGLATELQLKLPITNLVSAAHGWGFVELQVDPDDMIRRHNAGPEDIPSLSWRMAVMLGAPAAKKPGGLRVERWMNYYGSGDAIPSVSYFKALDETDAVLESFFRDKVVIIGAGSKSGYTGKRKDQFRNPYTWLTGRFSPGAEVHATALLNLLRDDWLRRPAWWAELGLVLLAGIGAGFALVRFRPAMATTLAVLGVAAVLGAAWLWMTFAHVWFGWLIMAIAQIPIALLCAVVNRRETVPDTFADAETREFAARFTAPATQPHVPEYELLQTIGRGAYGEVWLARSVTGILRAVKVVHRRSFQHDQQFEREFQGLVNFEPVSRLHEGLVNVLHVGRNDAAGFFYYVMELADDAGREGEEAGERRSEHGSRATHSPASSLPDSQRNYVPRTLHTHTSRGEPLPPQDCLRIGIELTSAMAFLHEKNLVHRDIKPANIIFVNGRAKLADIGLVADISEARTFVGTEGYIPLEGPGTPQADVFSAGKVLYELLTGWKCDRYPELPSPPSDSTDATIWRQLAGVVRRACATDVVQRYSSAQAMKTDLEKIKASE